MEKKFLEKKGKVFYKVITKVHNWKGEVVVEKKLVGGSKVFCSKPKDEFDYKEFNNIEEARRYFGLDK